MNPVKYNNLAKTVNKIQLIVWMHMQNVKRIQINKKVCIYHTSANKGNSYTTNLESNNDTNFNII